MKPDIEKEKGKTKMKKSETVKETKIADTYGRFNLKGKDLQKLEYALKRVFSDVNLRQITEEKRGMSKQIPELQKKIAEIDPEKAAARAKKVGLAKTVAGAVVSNAFFGGYLPMPGSPKEAGERAYDAQSETQHKLEQLLDIVNGLVTAYSGIVRTCKTINDRLPGDENLAKFTSVMMASAADENTFFAELCGYLDDGISAEAIKQFARHSDFIKPVYLQIMNRARTEEALKTFFSAASDEKQQWLRGVARFDLARKKYLEAETMRTYMDGMAMLDELDGFLNVSDTKKDAAAALDKLRPQAYKNALAELNSENKSLKSRIAQLQGIIYEFELLNDYKDSAAQKKKAERELEDIYGDICRKQVSAASKEECADIINFIAALGNYKDCPTLLEATRQRHKEFEYAELEEKLEKYLSQSTNNKLSEFRGLCMAFEKLDGYKDSAKKAELCRKEIEAIESTREKEIEAIESTRKKRIVLSVLGVLIAVVLIGVFLIK